MPRARCVLRLCNGMPMANAIWLKTEAGEICGQTSADVVGHLSPRNTAETSQATGRVDIKIQRSMSEQQSDHLTAGRRRRHKSPASIPSMHGLPLPKLLDHMGAEDGPSCSEAKRQRSASTTPRSVLGTLPPDYDRALGAASADSQEAVRFGEENDPETRYG